MYALNIIASAFFIGRTYKLQANKSLYSLPNCVGIQIHNELVHEISNNQVCATSKASDQPAQTRSLIRVFASRLRFLWLLSHLEFLSLKGSCRGSSKSTLVKMSNCWKSHATALMICTKSVTLFLSYIPHVAPPRVYILGMIIYVGMC